MIIHIIIMHFYMWSMLYTSIKSPNIKLSLKKICILKLLINLINGKNL